MIDDFKYRNGDLYCERIPLRRLAETEGTPLYVYSQSHFQRRIRNFTRALEEVPHEICYAVKCNGNLAILNRMVEAGSGFDIVSGGELKRVIQAGGDPDKIVFAGVGKTVEEQKLALDAGIRLFNLESIPELERLNEVAGDMSKRPNVALRVNPNIDARTHEKISTGKKENKFGLPIPLIHDCANKVAAASNLSLKGLHFHIGSQITSLEPFRLMIDKATDLVDDLRNEGHNLTTLNVGGGLGIRYRDEDTITPAGLAEVVVPEVKRRNLQLIVEPGRYLMGNAGVLLTEVQYVKESINKNFVIVDAGMNDLIRPAMYDAFHKILPVTRSGDDSITADVVGPICETGDALGKDRTIPKPTSGDYLAVHGAGAYGFAMSSQYNGFPRPAEILVHEDGSNLIRSRESYSDLWDAEKIPGKIVGDAG